MTTYNPFEAADDFVSNLHKGDTFYAAIAGDTEYSVGTFVARRIDDNLPWVVGDQVDAYGNVVEKGAFNGSVDTETGCMGLSLDKRATQQAVDQLNANRASNAA